MKRNVHLDILRCGMNYLIVLLHAWAAFQYVERGTLEFAGWRFVCNCLCGMAMPTFFLISGYLFFHGFSLTSWPKKVMHRIRRLLVPYLAWNTFFVIFYLSLAGVFPRLGRRVASFGLDTFSGALAKIVSLTVHPIDGPLWFIRTLFFLTLFSPLLWWLMRVKRGVLALVVAFAWCVAERTCCPSNTLHLVFPAYSVFVFVLGGVFALNGRDLVRTFSGWPWLAIGFGACALSWWGPALGRMACPLLSECVKLAVPLCVLAEAPALVSLVGRMPVKRIAESRLYGFCREMSFFAYAGHFLFCSMWLHVSAPLFAALQTGKLSLLIFIFFVPGLMTIAAVYAVARKCCPRILKLFDGTL